MIMANQINYLIINQIKLLLLTLDKLLLIEKEQYHRVIGNNLNLVKHSKNVIIRLYIVWEIKNKIWFNLKDHSIMLYRIKDLMILLLLEN